MKSQLEKAIELAQKTGDRIIVVDDNNDSALVLMGLDEYSDLVNIREDIFDENLDIKSLTEEELLDKINRDIVMWQERNKEEDIKTMEDDFLFSKNDEEEAVDDPDIPEENMYYYEETDRPRSVIEELEEQEDIAEEKNKNWQISSEVKNRAEEVD